MRLQPDRYRQRHMRSLKMTLVRVPQHPIACALAGVLALVLAAQTQAMTVAELRTLSRYNLETSAPTRSDLNADLGVGRTLSRGEGDEKSFWHCYALPARPSEPQAIRSLVFLFPGAQKTARTNGWFLSTQNLSCPLIQPRPGLDPLSSSPAYRLLSLGVGPLRKALPAASPTTGDFSTDELVIRNYEEKKTIHMGHPLHSPELAERLHQNRGASYQLDTTTSIRIEFENQKIKHMVIWLQSSH